MCVWSGGVGAEPRRHFPALGGDGRKKKSLVRNLRRFPSLSPSRRSLLRAEAAGFVRSGTARGSAVPHLREKRTRSPAQRAIPGTRPTPVLSRVCAHTFLPPCATPTPGAPCLPGARSASRAGPRGSSAASLRLWSPPLSPPHAPRRAAAPPTSPRARGRACVARGAGAGEPLACRCPARGGSGAARAPPAPPPGLTRAPERGDMSVATGSSEAAGGAGGGGARVFFQSPRGSAGGSPGSSSGSGSGSSREGSAPVAPVAPAAAAGQGQQQRRHQQGKVTVKYDRKELRKRLVLEEWIVEQLGQLYGCEVPGHRAWRVGGLRRPMCPHRNSPGLQLLGAHCPDSQGPSSGSQERCVLFPGCPLARGAVVGTPLPGFSCRVPGEPQAPLMAVGDGVGLGLAQCIAFLEPRGFLGSSCC